jgi:prolyl oligopeptidase
MTTSGYARIVKLWQRGTPMSRAKTVFEAQDKDLGACGLPRLRARLPSATSSSRASPSTTTSCSCSARTASRSAIDAPNSAEKGVHREWLTLQLREPLTEGGKTYPAGRLIATNFDAFMPGKRDWHGAVHAPTDHVSLAARRVDARLPAAQPARGREEPHRGAVSAAGADWDRSACRATRTSST